MKKYLMGLVAIAMAISLSAYTAPKKMPARNKNGSWDLWWFKIKPGQGPASGFTNSMVDFIEVSPYMPEYICVTFPWIHKCTIGFEVFDVDPSTNLLWPGTHFPVAIGELRPNP